jgi:hypothetical protein
MPQATDEAREQYRARFGDIGCEHAIEELKKRGFELTPQWEWICPRMPSDEELFWIGFLVNEWDFGWIKEVKKEA